MGFLNIAGGIAAGAQRADELEASRLAKTTKGDTQRLSLIEKIVEEGFDKYPSPSLMEMPIPQLFDVLGESEKFRARKKGLTQIISDVRNGENSGTYATIDYHQNPKTGNRVIISAPTIASHLSGAGGKQGDDLNTAITGLVEKYRFSFMQLADAYDGMKNVPIKAARKHLQDTFGALNNYAQDNTGFGYQMQEMANNEALTQYFSVFKEASEDQKNALFPLLKSYTTLFGGQQTTVPTGNRVSKEEASQPNNVTVDSADNKFSDPTQQILSSNLPVNSNNTATNDTVTDAGKKVFGLKSVRSKVLAHIEEGDRTSGSELSRVISSSVKVNGKEIDGLDLITDMFRKTQIPPPYSNRFKTINGVRVKQVVKTPAVSDLVLKREQKTAEKIAQVNTSAVNASIKIDDIRSLLYQQGVLRLVAERPEGGYDNASTNRRLIKSFIDSIPQEGQTVINGKEVSNAQIYNAGLSLYQDLTNLTKQEKTDINTVQTLGSTYLSNIPSSLSKTTENIVSQISGIVSLITQGVSLEALDNKITEIEDFNSEGVVLADEAVKGKFAKYVNSERKSHASSLKIMEENQENPSSIIYLRAQGAARLSFSKIQLAYTYAAISQGGVGSARTISDTDFANNLESLFSSQGGGLVAVMGDIQQQIDTEIATNRKIMTMAGTGKMDEFTGIAKNFSIEDNRRKRLERQKLPENATLVLESDAPSASSAPETYGAIPIEKITGSSGQETGGPQKSPIIPERQSYRVIGDNGKPTNEIANFNFKFVQNSSDIETEFYGDTGLPRFRASMVYLMKENPAFIPFLSKEGIVSPEGQKALMSTMFANYPKDSKYGVRSDTPILGEGNIFNALEVAEYQNDVFLNPDQRGILNNRNLSTILNNAKIAQSKEDPKSLTRADQAAISIAKIWVNTIAQDMAKRQDFSK